jgi:O-antigen/teichoic acid export membrane protein
VLFLSGVHLFYFRRPWLRPRMIDLSKQTSVFILRTGLLFFVLQLAMSIGYQSDTFVVDQVLGSAKVKEYGVPSRLFLYMQSLLWLIMAPLWPAYGEAVARGDMPWVKRTLKRSMVASVMISAIPSLLLVIFGDWIIRYWMRGTVSPTPAVLIGLGIWTVLYAVCTPLALLLNGANVVRFQIITVSLMAVVNITLSVLLTRKIGVPGVIYGSIIAQISCVLAPTLIYLRRILHDIEARRLTAIPTPESSLQVPLG